MDPIAEKLQTVEGRLFQSLSDMGGIIPQTVEQVECAENHPDILASELPERLRDAQQVFNRIAMCPLRPEHTELPHVFGQFVSMLRKKNGFSVESLAAKAKVDAEEICRIEVDSTYEPKPRTVSQLANAFGLTPKSLARLANLTFTRDNRIVEGAVRFAACSKNMDSLTKEQLQALKDFVKFLNSLD
jgi:transcriptional regulator with XRE-family HTH domain